MKNSNSKYWLYEKEQADLLAYLEATVGVGDTDRHYKLKTSDRGANPAHCREACQIAMSLSEEQMKSVTARYGCTVPQLLKAVTGRPRVHGKASDNALAKSKADAILNDLRKAAGKQIQSGTYKVGKIKHPDNAELIKADLEKVSGFAAEFEALIEAENAKQSKAPATSKQRRTRKTA